MPADGNTFTDKPPVRLYACCACKAPHRLTALDDDMLCSACGEPDEDELEPVASDWTAMRRDYGTWSV